MQLKKLITKYNELTEDINSLQARYIFNRKVEDLLIEMLERQSYLNYNLFIRGAFGD